MQRVTTVPKQFLASISTLRKRNRAIKNILWLHFFKPRGFVYSTASVCLYFVVGVLVLSFAIFGFGLTLNGTRSIRDLALPFTWIFNRAPESAPLIMVLAWGGCLLNVYANAGVRIAKEFLAKEAPTREISTRTCSTLVEFEFVELPDLPTDNEPSNSSYLLSMLDCSFQLAVWNASTARFEDSGGPLNPMAIRSWAVLPKSPEAT